VRFQTQLPRRHLEALPRLKARAVPDEAAAGPSGGASPESIQYSVYIMDDGERSPMAECAEYLLLESPEDTADAASYVRRLTTGYPTSMPADANAFHFATRVKREVRRFLELRDSRTGSSRRKPDGYVCKSYELMMAKGEENVFDMGICVSFDETDALWRLGAIPSLTVEAALLACRTAAHF
jgi:hypothetical protein